MEWNMILVIGTGIAAYGISLVLHRRQSGSIGSQLRQAQQEVTQLKQDLSTATERFHQELATRLQAHSGELQQLREQHRNALNEMDSSHRTALRKLEDESFQAGARQKELHYETLGAALKVSVRPYVRTTKKSSFISDSYTCDVGYQYQLMVQGIPCFAPHIQITDSQSYSELNDERIAMLSNLAMQAAQAAISIKNPAIHFDPQPIITKAKG